jgi:putative component of membrane protein insertase Oxa1/YidC/SpoIIIJ protein YidD
VSHRDEQKWFTGSALKYLFAGLILLVWVSAAGAEDRRNSVVEGMFDFYGTVISPIDGDRCPMYPSCTRYAKESIRKHGALIGWVMAMDRLVRCGRDEKTISRPYFSGNKKWIHDPVANNDFWWVDK